MLFAKCKRALVLSWVAFGVKVKKALRSMEARRVCPESPQCGPMADGCNLAETVDMLRHWTSGFV